MVMVSNEARDSMRYRFFFFLVLPVYVCVWVCFFERNEQTISNQIKQNRAQG